MKHTAIVDLWVKEYKNVCKAPMSASQKKFMDFVSDLISIAYEDGLCAGMEKAKAKA